MKSVLVVFIVSLLLLWGCTTTNPIGKSTDLDKKEEQVPGLNDQKTSVTGLRLDEHKQELSCKIYKKYTDTDEFYKKFLNHSVEEENISTISGQLNPMVKAIQLEFGGGASDVRGLAIQYVKLAVFNKVCKNKNYNFDSYVGYGIVFSSTRKYIDGSVWGIGARLEYRIYDINRIGHAVSKGYSSNEATIVERSLKSYLTEYLHQAKDVTPIILSVTHNIGKFKADRSCVKRLLEEELASTINKNI